ncbi:GAF domain-containing protein, partial [Nostoc sp.]|uniref:GAF domain-containing protein n=1 Tax=Nostoc sp. TaxID=1180 RepID=UPI002FF7213B
EQQVEARMMLLIAKAERERLVLAIALQIRSSLSLQTILDSTVTEVRQLLGCDRVNIWQFEPNWQTIVVAESTDSSLSLVGQRVGDTCLKQNYTEIYRQGRIRIVSDIYKSKISDCHRDMLIAIHTRAKILVPLFCGDQLWGLLNVAESQHPRDWEPEEVELLQALSVQLAVALQQATTHQKLQEQLIERQQAENQLRESEQRYIILNQELEAKVAERTTKLQEREAQLQTISERLALSLNSGAIGCWEWDIQENTILCDERVYALYGVTKTSDSYVNYEIWANWLHPDDLNPTEILLQQALLGKAEYDTEFRVVHPDASIHFIKAYGVVVRDAQGNAQKMIGVNFDISDRKRTELALQSSEMRFRRIFDSNVVGMLFADLQGKILDANDRFLEMVGYTRDDLDTGIDWLRMTPPEHILVDLVMREHLKQHGEITPCEKEYYRKDGSRIPVLIGAAILPGSENQSICIVVDISEQQAALRERKQAEETIRQQVEREQLLREITQRIRQSLDLQTIFDTACQEIRQVIQADRVGIFKFYPESNFDDGEFVAESVVEGFSSVIAIRIHDHCFGENYSSFYALGRFHVLDDIYNGGMKTCHTDILAQFQVRANLIMPLLCGDKLWGLLCIHQCATTRHWQQSEIDFTQQLSNQLAIAIQQANFYDQIQSELLVRQQTEARIALQLRRQETLGAIVQKIRESLDINEILATVTQQVKDVLHSDRVIVFRLFVDGRSQIVEEAVSGKFPALKDRHWENEVWSQEILDCYWQGKPRIVPDVMNDIWAECLVEYSREGQIQSKIVAPILQDLQGGENHRWVAQGVTNKLWGVLVIHACQEKRVWKDSEAQLLQQIANQLAIAIQQASLFEQLQQELAERQQTEAKLTQSNQQLAVSNQELARATRLKDEFLANMSHELRTPLNAILGMTEGLQEEVFGIVNEQQLKALQTIERSGSHLLELITDILDVAKIEAGQMELDYTSTSVAHLCQSSLVFIKQQALQKRIQLEIKLKTNLPDLLVDERRIRQVLINLLNNAVKFTPERGRITLEVTQLFPDISTTDLIEQHLLHFAITDTGIGISPENIKNLFQPFVQIDSALNRQYAGTGLGLALVKRIVELHGGKVGLTSELGVGSCFTIDLPYTPSSAFSPEITADNQPAVTPERDSSNIDLRAASCREAASLTPLILLAEDNEANISTVSSYLKAKGYRIVLAQNGLEAIDVAKTYHPDLILMDIQMPKMDGLEAMRQIRLDSNLVDIPIVALTALAMTEDRDRCLQAGASDYLSKPIKLKQLATTIQQLLNTTKDHK